LATAIEGRIVLLHVLAPPVIMTAYGMTTEDIASQLQQEEKRARQILERHAAVLRQQGIEVLTELREGGTSATIIDVAQEQAADLIVVGSHGHGAVYDLLVGSTTRVILRQAECPVLVVPHRVRAAAPASIEVAVAAQRA